MSTIPYELYVALSSTEPAIDGTGVTEPLPETGYTRAYIDNSNLVFNTANEQNAVTNHCKIYFPESILPWNDIKYYAIFDESENGNLLMYGTLSKTLNIPIKTIVSIPVDAFSISLKNEVV